MSDFAVKIVVIIISLGGASLVAGFVIRAIYKTGKDTGRQEVIDAEAKANETINKRALDALSRGAHARRIGVQPDDPNNRTKQPDGPK